MQNRFVSPQNSTNNILEQIGKFTQQQNFRCNRNHDYYLHNHKMRLEYTEPYMQPTDVLLVHAFDAQRYFNFIQTSMCKMLCWWLFNILTQ